MDELEFPTFNPRSDPMRIGRLSVPTALIETIEEKLTTAIRDYRRKFYSEHPKFLILNREAYGAVYATRFYFKGHDNFHRQLGTETFHGCTLICNPSQTDWINPLGTPEFAFHNEGKFGQ